MPYYLQSHYQDEIVPYYNKPYQSFDEACAQALEDSKNNIASGTMEVIAGEVGQQPKVVARYVSGKCHYNGGDLIHIKNNKNKLPSLAQSMLKVAESKSYYHNDVNFYYRDIINEIAIEANKGNYGLNYKLVVKYTTLRQIKDKLIADGFNVQSYRPHVSWEDSTLYIDWKVSSVN